MKRGAKTTLSHAISTERHTLERSEELDSWDKAFKEVRRLWNKGRRQLYLVARRDIKERHFVAFPLPDPEHVDLLEYQCRDMIVASKFVVLDTETKEQTSSADQTAIRAIALVYMSTDESFNDHDLPHVEF
ncbi:MAG: hypothetical protein WDN47_01500 [Candidatus Doudnabacteria bacterium]